MPASMKPLLGIAEEEAAELVAALGGLDHLTPQRRLLIEDVVTGGMLLRGALRLWTQTEGADPDAARAANSAMTTRQRALKLIGLDRVSQEIDLQGYLAEAAPAGDREGSK